MDIVAFMTIVAIVLAGAFIYLSVIYIAAEVLIVASDWLERRKRERNSSRR